MTMKVNRRQMLALGASALAATAAPVFTRGARAQDTVELKFSHWLPARHPMAEYMQAWADDLGAKSGGRLKITVYPAGQLGPVPDHYNMVRRGVADIGFILHGMTSDRFPLTSLIDLPFMVDSAVHGTKILNDPKIRAVLDPEHRGLKVLTLLTHQPGQILTVDKPIRVPADLEGLRIRFPSATTKAFLEELGASTVGLPPSAIAESIQKKVIDGVTIDYGGAGIAYRLGGSIGHVLELDAYVTTFGMVMNPKVYEGLPDDLRQLIDESVTGNETVVGEAWDKLNAPGKQALVDGGAEVHVPSEAEKAPFVEAGQHMADRLVAERAEDHPQAPEVLAMMKAAAETYRM